MRHVLDTKDIPVLQEETIRWVQQRMSIFPWDMPIGDDPMYTLGFIFYLMDGVRLVPSSYCKPESPPLSPCEPVLFVSNDKLLELVGTSNGGAPPRARPEGNIPANVPSGSASGPAVSFARPGVSAPSASVVLPTTGRDRGGVPPSSTEGAPLGAPGAVSRGAPIGAPNSSTRGAPLGAPNTSSRGAPTGAPNSSTCLLYTSPSPRDA